jgi:hypothetical protein
MSWRMRGGGLGGSSCTVPPTERTAYLDCAADGAGGLSRLCRRWSGRPTSIVGLDNARALPVEGSWVSQPVGMQVSGPTFGHAVT